MRVYCEFECDASCNECNWYNKECGCLLRPCNRDKLNELEEEKYGKR